MARLSVAAALVACAAAAALSGCGSTPEPSAAPPATGPAAAPQAPSPEPTTAPGPVAAPAPEPGLAPAPVLPAPSPGAAAATAPAAEADAAAEAGPGRWVASRWADLPGWSEDAAHQLWPALRAGCARPAPDWTALCRRILAFTPPDDGFAREFLQRELQPWRIETRGGATEGLATGYFEPLVEASRRPQPGFTVPLHRLPPAWANGHPGWSRQEMETRPEARAALIGHEIAWVASPLDVLLLQVQGSGRLRIREPDGRVRVVRLAYGGHNGQPYASVGRWLIAQGELAPERASWQAIRAWAELADPQRRQQMLWSNPRVVFFREAPLAKPDEGPRGAQGVPLTAGRSVAVDPRTIPYGTPLWLDTTEPLSNRPLRRLVMAQDTGSAIVGAVRIDLFWGTGDQAGQLAGRMKQPLRLWGLWPRERLPRLATAGTEGAVASAAPPPSGQP